MYVFVNKDMIGKKAHALYTEITGINKKHSDHFNTLKGNKGKLIEITNKSHDILNFELSVFQNSSDVKPSLFL